MTTTNVEKLVYNIFDETNRIVQQVKQQTYLYQQHLATNLLIQGFNPPPCFLNPSSHELNKEELISDLLLPPSRLNFPYSTGQCYLQSRLVVTGYNVVSLDKLAKDVPDSNKDLGGRDEPRPVQESHDYDVGYNSNCGPRRSCASSHDQEDARVPNISIKSGQSQGGSQMFQQAAMQDSGKVSDGSLGVNASNRSLGGRIEPMLLPDSQDADLGCIANPVPKCSPADHNVARISNLNIAPDQSLDRFQRSKSRQKALELRSSAKASKSRFSHENKSISFSGGAVYGIDLGELDHFKDLSVMEKSSDTNKKSSIERVCSRNLSSKSGTRNNCGRITRSKSKCSQQGSVNEPLKLDISHENVRKNNGKESCVMRLAKGIDQEMGNGAGGYCNQIKRSSSSCLKHLCLNETLESGRSTIQYENSDELFQRMDNDNLFVSKEMEVVIPFHASEEASDLRDAAMEKCKVADEKSSKYLDVVTRSIGSSRQPSSLDDSVDVAVGLGAASYIPKVGGSTCGVSSGELGFVAQPKKLGFDVLGNYRLNEHNSPSSVMESPEQSSQRRCHNLLEPEAPLEKSKSDCPSNVSSKKQLMGKSGASIGKTKTQRPFETNMEASNDIERMSQPYLNENLQVKHAEDDSKAGLYICHSPNEKDVSPSDLYKTSYLDVHQPNCHVLEGCPEQHSGEGHFCCERWTRSGIVPQTSQECPGSSADPDLTKLVTEDPKSCLDRDENMKNKPDNVLDARRCFRVDENNLPQHRHKFGCENIDNLVGAEKMALVEGCLDIIEEGVNISGSVGDPQSKDNNFSSLGFGETQPTYTSSFSKNRSKHTKANSWPQFKWRKIEGQQTNSLSASPSFRAHRLHDIQVEHITSHSKTSEDVFDAGLKLPAFYSSHEQNVSENFHLFNEKIGCHETLSSLMLKRKRVEEEFGFEEQIKVVEAPSTSEHEEIGPCFISSLSKHVTKDLDGSFVVDYTTSYPARHIGNADDLTDGDILTSTRSAFMDSISHLKEGNPVGSPCNKELAFSQNIPVEGFVLNEHSENGKLDTSRDGIDFGELNTTCTSIQRASILEQICRTASMCTPISHFSSTYKPLKNEDVFVSLPNGLLEHTNITCILPLGDDADNQLQATSTDGVDSVLRGMLYSDCLPYSGARYGWNSKNIDTPPAGKYCERIPSKSMSSEKLLGSNPELMCFPIEEDPMADEENENFDEDDDNIQEDVGFPEIDSCAKGEALLGTEEVLPNPPASISQTEKVHHIGDLHSSNAEVLSSIKQRLRNHCSNSKSKNRGKENQLSSAGSNSIEKVSESLQNRFSKAKLSSTTSIRRESQRLSEKVKHNNIVSNVTSFVPTIQQKKAAAVCKGKRDIKVRALEAAEAAKRLEEKKEKERKIKKEALKLERAKIEQETLRQRELDKRKKEEELKKKYADIAARKRLREEEGRKEQERKRKRIGVEWQNHSAQEEKVFAGKVEREKKIGNKGKNTNSRKESSNRIGKVQSVGIPSSNENTLKKSESQTESKPTECNIPQVTIVSENCEILSDCDGSRKLSMLNQLSLKSGVASKESHEKSYEMSPYQHSDDEEEDEVPPTKFIPSWASRNSVATVLRSQQIDPSVIFPRESFCRVDEVVLPRHLH